VPAVVDVGADAAPMAQRLVRVPTSFTNEPIVAEAGVLKRAL